jgi:lysophospholipase L1-like esterase
VRTRLAAALVGVVALLASCGIGFPTPTVTPVAGHHEILMVGDSILGNTISVLPGVLAAHGLDATIDDAHINGSGLASDAGFDGTPLDYLKRQLAAHPDVDTVVFGWTDACAQCPVAYGSPQFFDLWTANAHTLIDYLHATTRPGGGSYHIVWVQTPPMPPGAPGTFYENSPAVAQVLNWKAVGDYAPRAGGTADFWRALSDVNLQYQQWLHYEGAWHRVRADDAVHLTDDGATRAATWLAAGLSEAWR